jgi:hypothetical protein
MHFLCSAPVRSYFRLIALVALLTLAVTGCGRRGDVAGKVTYKGKPLVFGTVQFEGSDHLVKQGNINSDGTYSVRGVTTGEAKIAVSSINPSSSDFQVRGPVQVQKAHPRPEVKGWFPIPQEYQNLSKPKLSYTVNSGQNTFDIELK